MKIVGLTKMTLLQEMALMMITMVLSTIGKDIITLYLIMIVEEVIITALSLLE